MRLRSGRLESDCQKYHVPIWHSACKFDRFDWRIGNTHVSALRFGSEEIGPGSRNPQHVAVRHKSDIRAFCKRDCLVDGFKRGHAHRAAGPVNELQFFGKEFIETVAHDRVGLAPADLHQHPGTSARKRDFGGQDSRDLPVPILVDVLHGGPIPKKNLARFEHRGGDLCHKVFKAAACAG